MFELFSPEDVAARGRTDVRHAVGRARNGIRLFKGELDPVVAQSPKETVWSADKVRLFRYRNDARAVRTPVLIVHSLVTRSYVFDLAPGNSVVETLTRRGFDVYLVDWGVPDELEARNRLETYAEDYLPRIVAAVARVSGSESVNLLGYCFGGVLSLLYLAAAQAPPVSSAVLMATPVDFHQLGPLSAMLRSGRLEPDDVIDHTGNVPPSVLISAFASLRPTGPVASYVTLLQHLWDDGYVAGHQLMSGWASDHVPFPGAAFKQVARLMARDNRLAAGTFPLAGRRVDLADIKVPLLNIVGAEDHIVRPAATGKLAELVGSTEFEELRVPAGHVGLFMGSAARRRTLPAISDWFASHS